MQVSIVEKLLNLQKRKSPGFFVEAGAGCGEFISNTLYLELKYNWTGLLVEPNPDLLKLLLSKHRNSWILPHCLSTTPYVEVVDFDASMYNGGIILEGKIKPSMLDRDIKENPLKDFEREIRVQCFPLFSVLKALDAMHIDYFSLDIEGAEFAVLKTIPWNKINVTLLGVEVNHAGDIFSGTEREIIELLEDQGFELKATAVNDIFFLNKSCKKPSNKSRK